MADTPRGPRPTVTRRVAAALLGGWLLVCLLSGTAALLARTMPEDGWQRERLRITHLPYADCSSGNGCTMRPTVELPDGSRRHVTLTIRHPDELLPSRHFARDGTLLLWLKAGEQPRSLRPIAPAARTAAWLLLGGAAVLAILLVALAIRAERRHHQRRAGHVTDHLATWGAPALATLVLVTVLVMHQQWRTPTHDPTRPPVASSR